MMEGCTVHHQHRILAQANSHSEKGAADKVFKYVTVSRSLKSTCQNVSLIVCRQVEFNIDGHGRTELFEPASHQEEANQSV